MAFRFPLTIAPSRRQFLATTSSAALVSSLNVCAQDRPRPDPPARQHFPRMLQEWYVRRVRTKLEPMQRRRRQLSTAAQAEAYVQEVREKIRLSFGPFPEKTPLNAKVTKRTEREHYTIENIIFESRPGFLVTANLYLPKSKQPAPGVVGTCGHSMNGKMAEAYQGFAQGLARQGYVVLIYDPIGQGERIQYLDENLKPTVGGSVRDHLLAGNQQYLVGEFIGSWRAWDGIRALDYLLTRPEVDKSHIGVTGNSGGGTMTTWLCGVERRWTMAAPSCFVTSFQRNVENELPADTEQCPPRAIELGLDHLDFLAAMAPKPVIILAKERDYFDVRGSQYAFEELKRIYRLLDAEDRIGLFVGPTYHGYSQENREAMYGWFNRWTGIAKGSREPELTMESEETLRCTPRGQVAPLGSKTVFDFTREKALQLRRERPKISRSRLPQQVRSALRLAELPKSPPPYRILRAFSYSKPKAHATPYAVQTEPGIFALVYRLSAERHYSRPHGHGKPARLYVADQSSDWELKSGAFEKHLAASVEQGAYACDLRGVGESRPNTCGGTRSFYTPYGNDYFYAAHAIMLGSSVVGQRTFDLLRVCQFLKQAGHSNVELVARGWNTPSAVFAALIDNGISKVTLVDRLESFEKIATSRRYEWPLSTFVPRILHHFDLPDCYAALEAEGRLERES